MYSQALQLEALIPKCSWRTTSMAVASSIIWELIFIYSLSSAQLISFKFIVFMLCDLYTADSIKVVLPKA